MKRIKQVLSCAILESIEGKIFRINTCVEHFLLGKEGEKIDANFKLKGGENEKNHSGDM